MGTCNTKDQSAGNPAHSSAKSWQNCRTDCSTCQSAALGAECTSCPTAANTCSCAISLFPDFLIGVM